MVNSAHERLSPSPATSPPIPPADRARLQFTLYQNDVTDFLNSVSSLIGSGISSVDSQRIRGLEFQIEGGIKDWRYLFNGSYIIAADQKALNLTGGHSTVEVFGIPRTRFNLGISRYIGQWNLSLLLRYQRNYRAFSGSVDITDPIKIPSTREINLALNTPAFNLGGGVWNASVMLNNLTDARNFDANIRRSGTNRFLQDGRNFLFSINAGY